jgi:hypothetical protein
MTDEVSNSTKLVRQTFERLIKQYPGAADTQLLRLLARASRTDDEFKQAAFEWTSRDLIRKLRARGRGPLRKSRPVTASPGEKLW